MSEKKIRKTHRWDIYETLEARCPYCRQRNYYDYVIGNKGDIEICEFCEREFELGAIK